MSVERLVERRCIVLPSSADTSPTHVTSALSPSTCMYVVLYMDLILVHTIRDRNEQVRGALQ